MLTITYINIIVLLFVLILTALLGSRSKSYHKEFIEMYNDLDVLIADKGLPLSFAKGLNVRDTSYYKEVEGDAIDAVLVHMIDILYKDDAQDKTIDKTIDMASIVEKTDAPQIISQRLVKSLNKELNKKQNKVDDFSVLISDIQGVENTLGTDYVITTRHIVHRASRMYGFVIFIRSLWTTNNKLKGVFKYEVTGILPEDALQTVQGCNQTEANNVFRPYTDSVSFIQSEAIMKSKQYEDNIIKEQVYGLSQDRGISSKSFVQ